MRAHVYRWLLPLAGGILGLAASFVWPAQYGAATLCPSGASEAACHLPPALVAQHILWSLIGIAVGLVAVFAVRVFWEPRSRSGSRA
jgi:hypothetical protein